MNVKKDNRREGRLSRGKQPRLTDKEPKEVEGKVLKYVGMTNVSLEEANKKGERKR